MKIVTIFALLFSTLLLAQQGEDLDNQELETLLKREEARSQELINKAQAIADGKGTSVEFLKEVAKQTGAITPEEEKKAGTSLSDFFEAVDIYKLMKQTLTPFREHSAAEVKENLVKRLVVSPAAPLVKHTPRLIDYFVVLLRDPEAVPMLSKVLKEKEKLKYYGIFFLLTILVSWIWARKMSKKRGIFGSILRYFWRLLFWNVIRLGTFYLVFKTEVTPIVQVTINFLKS